MSLPPRRQADDLGAAAAAAAAAECRGREPGSREESRMRARTERGR